MTVSRLITFLLLRSASHSFLVKICKSKMLWESKYYLRTQVIMTFHGFLTLLPCLLRNDKELVSNRFRHIFLFLIVCELQ